MQVLCNSARSVRTIRPHGKRLCVTPVKNYRTRSVACSSRNATNAGIPSSVLLESIKADKALEEHLTALRSFDFMVDMHMTLQELVNQQAPLQLAPTAVSNQQGVLLVPSKGDGPLKQATLRVQTLTGPQPIDWVHHTFAIAPGFAYSKSSVYTSDESLLPHLELEMGTAGDGNKVLLYINMDPRLSLTVNGHYLDYFYNTPPPTSSTSSSSNSISWMEIESKAAQTPSFTRFTSPSLHIRACSASAILFYVESTEEGRSAAQQILREATNCWLAWLASGGPELSGTNPEAVAKTVGASAVLPQTPERQEALLEELAVRSTAWRRFPRREKMAGGLIASFGQQAMDDYWDSMAGDARIRRGQ